jgi:hypothetical protein
MSLILPLESAKFIISNAKHVKICNEGIDQLSKMVLKSLKDKDCNYFDFKSFDLNPKEMNEDSVNWIFVVDTLNFSFWSVPPNEGENLSDFQYKVSYKNQTYHGYWALCAAINRAIDEGFDITNPKFYSKITECELEYIFRSSTSVKIPLFEERLKVLRETGRFLNDNFEGNFVNCIKAANKSAKKLLEIIVDNFPSYRDEANYQDRKVTFYKRAQILIADIWACFEGRDLGEFNDIDDITMFADYRVPQVLRFYKSIDYSDELNEFLKKNQLMKTGDQFEIRAASILACNLITENVKNLFKNDINDSKVHVNDILVDYFIWNFRRDYAVQIEEYLPCHKIRCIFY